MYKLTVDGKLIEVDAGPAGEEGGGSAGGGGAGASRPAAGAAAAAAAAAATAARSPAGSGAALAGGRRWTVHTGGGRSSVVEYTYATMDILVNDIKAAVEGEFVEEEEVEGGADPGGGAAAAQAATISGVRYQLLLGPSLLAAQLTVIPSETGRGPPECVLVANGVIIRPQGE